MTNCLLRKWFQLLTLPLNFNLNLHKSEQEIIFLLLMSAHRPLSQLAVCSLSLASTSVSLIAYAAQIQLSFNLQGTQLCFPHSYHTSFAESP